MLKILFTLPIYFLSMFVGNMTSLKPKQITLCHGLAENDMRQFALDPEFQALHPSPMALAYEGMGAATTFTTADGTPARGYLIKANKKSKKWLFVYQEWWGLNDHIKAEADKYYKDLAGKVNVLAVDMYDGKSTSNPADAGKYMSETKEDRLVNIVNGAYAFAGKKAKVANVGWCFGGAWSLRSAILGGKKNIGSVMYYGMPVDDVSQLKTLNSDVLGLFATETRISKAVIEKFAENMKSAGKKLDYTIYDGVHGFSNPSNPKYDSKITADAYAKSIAYLKGKLL